MSALETVKTVNAAVRTFIAAVVVGVLGIVGYQGYELYQAPQLELKRAELELNKTKAAFAEARTALEQSQKEVGELQVDVARKAEQIERLDTSLRLIKVKHRLAELRVLSQHGNSDDQTLVSRVSFVETNDEGHGIGAPREFEIAGDMVYVDYLVAKFDDEYVEQADLDRGTAICLFQRIFGENQEPSEGFELDRVGSRPTAYARGGSISEFEQQIWDDFWTIANDPERAKQIGIRAAHGNAASIRVKPGKKYLIELRSTGEFSLKPTDDQVRP
jgi:hypothetical protein